MSHIMFLVVHARSDVVLCSPVGFDVVRLGPMGFDVVIGTGTLALSQP